MMSGGKSEAPTVRATPPSNATCSKLAHGFATTDVWSQRSTSALNYSFFHLLIRGIMQALSMDCPICVVCCCCLLLIDFFELMERDGLRRVTCYLKLTATAARTNGSPLQQRTWLDDGHDVASSVDFSSDLYPWHQGYSRTIVSKFRLAFSHLLKRIQPRLIRVATFFSPLAISITATAG